MNKKENSTETSRRNAMRMLATGSAAGLLSLFDSPRARAERYVTPQYAKGAAPVTIKKVRAITTAPGGSNLVIVKVETSEPGLYGLGCATFTQRAKVVVPAVDIYLDEFCVGKDVDNIEDMWQSAYVSSYWRNDAVLNNALSGLDQALWDIKGKRANVPVHQLLGGKARIAVDTYTHASGPTPEAIADKVQQYMSEGFRHIRIQQGGYGGVGAMEEIKPDFKAAGFGRATDDFSDQRTYLKRVPKMFEMVRKRCGEDIELLHDMHELVEPMDAINMIKGLEEYRPYFIEDPFSPENMGWFKQLRQSTTVPIAMGELFNNINEFRDPMANQLFDYIRCHISQIGGITPAIKVARLGEWFNVKTAWHGPGDTSPVGHSANNNIDIAVWNFGIQESQRFSEKVQEVFPGCPTIKNGYYYVNETPGLGIDINEKEAAKYPIGTKSRWTVRKSDGTLLKP
ncbi:D-mannonate dehydratase CC2812 [Dyadobacter endophyticus]|uniref:D-mannonate dehydratase CC2812 n=1 Tax=Dyadobacter endophyticus TaxID=1749036 RepID=A0ABQ1YSC0_9BACT|nr:enolase C-terminal domain-like protein [Dyadobacter endophyticus]GGH36016.1 D-mannonate dehydratase CC2812 [Dyadobacter endophyticus]